MKELRQVPSKCNEERASLIQGPSRAHSSKLERSAVALWCLCHRELICYPNRVPSRAQKHENLLYIFIAEIIYSPLWYRKRVFQFFSKIGLNRKDLIDWMKLRIKKQGKEQNRNGKNRKLLFGANCLRTLLHIFQIVCAVWYLCGNEPSLDINCLEGRKYSEQAKTIFSSWWNFLKQFGYYPDTRMHSKVHLVAFLFKKCLPETV